MKKFTIFLLFLPLTFNVFGGNPLTIEKAIENAYSNNPNIIAFRKNLKASKLGENVANKEKFGELNMNLGYKKSSDDLLVRPMSKDLISLGFANMPFDSEYTYWNFDYKLPLYTGGKIKASEKIAKENKKVSSYKLTSLEWDIKYKVKKVYLNIVSLNKQLNAMKDYLKSLESLKQHIDEGYKLGKFANIDVLKVNYQIEESQFNIENIKQLISSLNTSLKSLMGDNSNNTYDLVSKVDDEITNKLPKLEDLIVKAYNNRSDLKASESFVNIRKYQVKINKADWLPKLNIDSQLTGVNSSNIDFNDQFWSITANVSFKLFDMGKRRSKIKQAKTLEKAALQLVNSKKLTLKQTVIDAYTNVQKQFQNYKTAESSLNFQKEVERVEQLKYENGKGNIDDLLFAKARKNLSISNLIKGKYQYFIAKEELKKSIEGEI